ncbi:hypothetical protein ACJX0J_033451, partial [Zea mays]
MAEWGLCELNISELNFVLATSKMTDMVLQIVELDSSNKILFDILNIMLSHIGNHVRLDSIVAICRQTITFSHNIFSLVNV